MQLKKDMELELQTFDLEDVERLSEPIFETCLSYLNSNLANTKLEKIDVKYNVGFFDDDRVSAYADKNEEGYDVYRFGGKELYDMAVGKKVIKKFFKMLFEKYGFINE